MPPQPDLRSGLLAAWRTNNRVTTELIRSLPPRVNLVQSATVQAVSGYALAGSNVAYDFPPPFFSFT